MERDNNLRKEIQNLTWDRDLAKNEVRLLDRNVEILELQRSKLEEKLRRSQRKCKELEETVRRISTENLKLKSEKKNNRLAGVYQEEECKCAAMHQLIEDSRKMKSDYDRVVEKLKLGDIESNKIIQELRLEKMESDKEAQMYKTRLKNLTRTSKMIEENLANILNVKMGDIATWLNDLSKYGTSEVEGNLDSQGFRVTKENCSGNDDVEVLVVDVTSPSNGSRNIELTKKGDKNSVQPRTRENDDDAKKAKTSPGIHNPPQEESIESKKPLSSGTLGGGLQLLSCSSKYACSSPAANDNIVEIVDSDEDTNPDGVTQIPSIGIFDPKVVTNEANLVPIPLSSQTSKQDKTDSEDGLFVNFTAKRKRDVCTGVVDKTAPIHEKGNQILKPTNFGMNSSLEKFNCISDDDSADSEDESLSDSKMVEMVESLRSKHIDRKLKYDAQMSRAFQHDEELCMSAVCAHDRQQSSLRKSKEHSSSSKNGGFRALHSVSVHALAEYLIGRDHQAEGIGLGSEKSAS